MTAQKFTLAESEVALLPDEAAIESWHRRGWYLSGKLLTDAEVDAMASAAERFYAGVVDRPLPSQPPGTEYWRPADGDIYRHNDYIFYEDDTFREVLSKPLIAAIAARLQGATQMRLWQSTLILKPPNAHDEACVVPWHNDRDYWRMCSSELLVTIFIPFHDCPRELGTITMIDGSHRWSVTATTDDATRHFRYRDRRSLERFLLEMARRNGDTPRYVPMEIAKGHMSFHHARTYHGSDVNRGDRARRAVSIHLQPGDNHWRPVPRPDGGWLAYKHDALVARTALGHPDYRDPEFCPVLWDGALP